MLRFAVGKTETSVVRMMTSAPTHRSKQHIIQDIEAVTRQHGFLYTLLFLCGRDLFVDPNEAATRNWRESLLYQELGLLSGLLVKHTLQTAHPSADVLAAQVSKVDVLLAELHDAYKAPMINSFQSLTATAPTPPGHPLGTSVLYGMGDFFAEAIFYAGAGAYDFQYLDLAAKRYEGDAEWIVQHRGFSIEAACEIARQLKGRVVTKRRVLTPRPVDARYCDQLLSVFSFEPRDITGLGPAEIDSFLEAFSLEPGAVNQDFNIYGDYNAFDARPIIRLDNGRYLLLVYFLLAQSIYESPFYWMNEDLAYRDIASANRGKATTSIAYEMMVQVFGPGRVFQDVRVMRNRREAVTDIDILAFVGNKAVVIQAKSKKLTQLARRGSADKLRADFKAAIQNGYDQAIASRRALLDRHHTLLDNAGNELRLDESLDNAYLVCLTSDNYPSLSLQTAHFLARKAGSPAPIAISLLDLEVVTFYLKDPVDFVYYQRQRAATADFFLADNEVVLLAHHLSHDLRRSPGYEKALVDASCAQWIDAHFAAARGQFALSDALMKRFNNWKNDGFSALVNELKQSGVPGFTDAVFMLYELSSELADEIVSLIEATRLKTARDGKRHSVSRAVGKEDGNGISFVCMPDGGRLFEDVVALGILKKYQLRANEWLSLGSFSRSSKMIDVATFTKEPWEADPELDALVRRLKSRRVIRAGKKIHRNATCPCGSGLKFKNCCGR